MSIENKEMKRWDIDCNKRELFEFDAGYEKHYRFGNDSIVSIAIWFYEMDLEQSQIDMDIQTEENMRWC